MFELPTLLGAFSKKNAKSDYDLRHVCPCVYLHGITRLPLDEFLYKLLFGYISETCVTLHLVGYILEYYYDARTHER
jgi:hypothetical protein